MAVRHIITIFVLLAMAAPAWGQAVAGRQPIRVALTDCTAEVGGLTGELCLELDDDALYSCQPSQGRCDTAGEWVAVSGGSGLPSGCSDAGSGVIECAGFQTDPDNAVTNVAVEIAAPGAPDEAGEHNWYWDSTSGRLCDHKNGAGATHCFAYAFSHATDCTSVTAIDTGVALLIGDTCQEADADTFYVYDGSAWDQVGAGGSSYIELFYWLSGVGVSSGYSTTNYAPGIWTSSLALGTGSTMQVAAVQFQDADAEIAYFRGQRLSAEKVSSGNLAHVNFEAEVSIQTSTASDTVSFLLGVSCVSPGEATNTAFGSMSYTALTAMSGTSTGTAGQLFILSSTDQDITAGSACAVGDIPIYKVEADETSAGMDNTVNFMSFRVWTD